MKAKDPHCVFGNAAETLDYASNGEAGDWLLGAKNVLNLDVELGNDDDRSNRFYNTKVLFDKIVRYNMIIMKDFLYKHIINFTLKKLVISPN